jgi:hypothetical protein
VRRGRDGTHTQRAPREKGLLSAILESRASVRYSRRRGNLKRKKESCVLDRRWGREAGHWPGKSKERGGGEYELAPLCIPVGGGARCGARRRRPRQMVPPRLFNPRTLHRKSQRRRWKQERGACVDSAPSSCSPLPASPPPLRCHAAPITT